MSYPSIYRFIDRVRGISPNAREFSMTIADAKALQSEITKLLLSLESLRDTQPAEKETVEKIEVRGGKF